jgi:hypothetical protein
MALLLVIFAFSLGLFAGVVSKGINITITHKQEELPKKQEYNESLVDLLPNNVKQYYHDNLGRNNF